MVLVQDATHYTVQKTVTMFVPLFHPTERQKTPFYKYYLDEKCEHVPLYRNRGDWSVQFLSGWLQMDFHRAVVGVLRG